ncbi:MAG TPA: M14 family zinc carboxypeptidase, partial [Thermoanaerobaculia bacterium]|nr:M14 family zinc carboxypeptidase [Thermoanaerobaculia bacterium]
MRTTFLRRYATLALGVLLIGPGLFGVDYGPYHSFSEVQSRLQQWSSNPHVKLLTIGRSAGGHPLYVVRLASGSGDPDARTAIFVGANVAGSHNAGTEAALDLIERLIADGGHSILQTRTFYVAPILNPDAHDALFGSVRRLRSGNAMPLDHDVDGLIGEDDFNDLDGDGRITLLRIPDAAGGWLPHAEDPRVMVRSDALKERAGAFRIEKEGIDDDRDGRFNEDPKEGIAVDMNFPKAFPYPKPEAGPWPTRAPETHALIAWLFDRQNIALAIVYGPANNLLEIPRPIEAGADLGTQKFKIPQDAAEMLGFDPEEEYTLDQVWEVAQNLPFVVQNNITREQVAQFLGAGPATKLEDADQKLLDHLAKDYKERLKKAGLDPDRPAEQYGKGGLTPWLYYDYGVPAIELDVWGIPKAKKEEKTDGANDEPLTVDSLEEMSSEDFLALGEEKIAAFLKEIEAPAQFTAPMVIDRVRSG